MPIQTDGPLMEPENKGIDEFHVGYGASMRATAAQAWEDSPIHQLIGINEMDRASGKAQPDFGEIASGVPTPSNGPEAAEETQPAASNIDIIDANDRVKKAGLAPHLKLPDQPDIPPAQLAIMMDRARRRQELDATIDRGPQGFVASALDVGTSFAVGAVDPLNLASAFVPVMGELRYGKLLASAGDSMAARLAVRAGVGASEGVTGQAALEPLDWWSHTQDGRDFGMADVLHNLMFGAALGGGLHAGGGFISDAYRDARGRALYPFGPGEPMENVAGTHVPGHLMAEEGVGADALHDHLGEMMTRPEAPQASPVEDRATRLMDTAVPADPQNSIVFLDADKVHAMLAPMDRALTESKQTGAKDFIASAPETWNPPHMAARVSKHGADRVEIIDGVHRWAAMHDEGMNVVPVEMDAASVAKARQMGLLADRNQARPATQPVEPARVPEAPAAHMAAEETAPPSPAVSIINDLPPRAHEDAMRGAIASLIDGEPVKAGEMLEAAAQTDPRIRESFEAFHGSPHEFEQFDLSKIGSGEGAQAYGHGLYFAENEKVARGYQRTVSDKAFIDKVAQLYDEGHSPDDAWAEVKDHWKEFSPGEQRLMTALEKDDWLGFDYPHQAVSAALHGLKNYDVSQETKDAVRAIGNMYRVKIKADPEHFLDWDKPFNEQSEHVQRALREHPDQSVSGLTDKWGHDMAALYGRMSQRLGQHIDEHGESWGAAGPSVASKTLREAGIPGIKYLDQGSRDGKGGRSVAGQPFDPKNPVHIAALELSKRPGDREAAARALDAFASDAEPWNASAAKILRSDVSLPAVAEEGTRNFVVFNDKDIEITHKNGEPVKREEIKRPEPAPAKAPRGRAAADPQTWSLYEFLSHEGGLKPDQELRAIFGNDRGPFVPSFGPLVRPNGRTFDDALRLAKDHGYLFDAADVTGAEGKVAIRDLLDKLAEENSGRKQYRNDGQHATRAEDKASLERETHEIVSALHDEIEATSGVKGSRIDPRLESRVVEIITREGEHDVLAAYERVIMEDEERYNAETGHRAEPGPTDAGRQFPDDAGAAQDRGRAAAAAGATAGRAGPGAGADAGGQPRSGGAGNRAAPQAQLDKDAAWRQLAARKPDFDDPDTIAASKAADAVKPPPTKLDERVSAAEKADAFAKQMYDMFAHRLPEEDRVRLDDLIKRIDDDNEARETAIVRGGSCLFGVV